MKKSNCLKVMAVAASSLFLTGCPIDFDFTQPPRETTVVPKVADIDETAFPDPVFREYVLTNIDTDKDGILTVVEVAHTSSIDVSYLGVKNLTGSEHFRYLQSLNCTGNLLTTLDISAFPDLVSLTCNKNPIKDLDVSDNIQLQTLRTADTLLTNLDVSKLKELTYLIVDEEVVTIGAEREGLEVTRLVRSSTHPEWETDPE